MEFYEDTVTLAVSPHEVFSFIDDHVRFSSHMNNSSWMMGGGSMKTDIDDRKFKAVGSHIRMTGKAFGISLYLDEIVTEYDPPNSKAWKTVGAPRLIIIGYYEMKVKIAPENHGSLLSVSIKYELPVKNAWLGVIFGPLYAKWCVQQMLKSTIQQFANN